MSASVPPDDAATGRPASRCRRERPDAPPLRHASSDCDRNSDRDRSPRRRDRAQTTTDYAVGAGIFLLAVGFTFAFIPGMLDPFTGGAGQDRTVVADRVATELAAGGLGDPAEPYALDTECTLAFFAQVADGEDNDDDCRYDTDADSVGGALGIADLESVQVTLERNVSGNAGTEVVCRDGTDHVVATEDCSEAGNPEMTAGAAPPASASVVVAQRSVEINDTQYTLYVRVW